jgi:transcription antitermination factor NusG
MIGAAGLPAAWLDLAWHVLRVDPQRERLVQAMLGERGVPAFVPLRRETRPPTRRQIAAQIAAAALTGGRAGDGPRARPHRRARKPVRIEPVEVEVVALPGYVFAAVPSSGWCWLLRADIGPARHVRAVLVEDGRPARVRVDQLDLLARRSADGSLGRPAHQRGMPRGREYAVGDRVEVLAGALAGWTCEVSALTGWSAEVVVPLMGGGARVHVALDQLAAA